ncbi:hypothetical protein SASPL_134298 [Salvia splendens]|uniref:Uncharacterized protein n=1 Tax=Salvia splendens TaxID=180675 RepID=A0A8X8X489_SALSN|nr:hypothetical protein SASPL_134294 [Salvia splendens]KAG6406686.1 hypothetical protein SASPL_134295 [Salvia splendens]KAG6406689.1 hypothetical protein SASPL_134298 [Salvia splendens]
MNPSGNATTTTPCIPAPKLSSTAGQRGGTDVSYEQLEQLRNSLMMFEHGAEAKLNGGGSSAAAGVKPSPP